MRKTTLALATATLLGGLALGTGSASAATPAGPQVGAAPTTYVAMMSKKQKMMMMKKKKMMMRKKMMMKKKMM